MCIAADPGFGKTASVAMLAVKYANKSDEMKEFDFAFTIRLKYVDETSSLPELIVQQHEKLKPEHVSQIRAILEGKTKHKVALLLDGYDEYKKGTNKEIDGSYRIRDRKLFSAFDISSWICGEIYT